MTDFSPDTLNDLELGKSVLIDIPQDIIFPNELNKFLKEKVEYLSYENGMLKKNVHDYEIKVQKHCSEIKDLKGKLMNNSETVNDFGSATTLARTKIVELSKKLREKNAEIESLKSKYAKVEQELANQKVSNNLEIIKPVKDKKILGELQSELKTLHEKYNSANSKLFDEKNANLLLRNELKLAQKLLQEEIGESFESVQQLSSAGSWKGRAETIRDLQHKNTELREKLRAMQEKEGVKYNEQMNQKRQIWEHKLEKANKELEAAKADNVDLRKKLEAAKTKTKAMEVDILMWKTKFNAISEQSERDRELISTITSQQSLSVNAQNEMMKKKENIIEKLHKELKNLKQDLKMEACKVENMQTLLDEKEAELSKAKQNNSFPFDSTKSDDRLNQRIEAEQIRFAELILLSNQRLSEEREAKCNAEYLYRQERQRAAKLEAKLTRMQLGEITDRSLNYSSILSKYSSDTDKNFEYKLELAEENIKALQTRLQMEKRERELDLAEFTKILKNCKCTRE